MPFPSRDPRDLVNVCWRIPKEDVAAIKALARKRGITTSEQVRQYLARGLRSDRSGDTALLDGQA